MPAREDDAEVGSIPSEKHLRCSISPIETDMWAGQDRTLILQFEPMSIPP